MEDQHLNTAIKLIIYINIYYSRYRWIDEKKKKDSKVGNIHIYIYKDLQKNNVIGILGYGIFK